LVIWDFNFNLWIWSFRWNDTSFSDWSGHVVHKIVIIWGEEAIFIVSRNTNSWILDTSQIVVTNIDTHVFRNNVLGINGRGSFLSGIVNISHSFFVLPRISNIEEEPVVSWDTTSI
jgi:hypothetical protein